MDLLEKATEIDHQNVNHLFIEIKILVFNQNGVIESLSLPLRWNLQKKKLTFILQDNDTPIIDFVSRYYLEEKVFLTNQMIYRLPADSHPSALYNHSEALFFGLFNETTQLFEEVIESQSKKIINSTLVYYSSLDSCDECLSLIHHYSSKLPLKQIFISYYPCKKSSYLLSDNDTLTPLSFNKERQCFFKNNEVHPFIASKTPLDLAKTSFNLVSYIHSISMDSL
ncbi:hypothetical protein N9Y92_01055 [Chlamydiales bacterium]|nr:hypothetical protein [Chlamydiales bacterium]